MCVVVVLEAMGTEAALVLADLWTQPYTKSLHLTEQFTSAFLNKYSRPAKRETGVIVTRSDSLLTTRRLRVA